MKTKYIGKQKLNRKDKIVQLVSHARFLTYEPQHPEHNPFLSYITKCFLSGKRDESAELGRL